MFFSSLTFSMEIINLGKLLSDISHTFKLRGGTERMYQQLQIYGITPQDTWITDIHQDCISARKPFLATVLPKTRKSLCFEADSQNTTLYRLWPPEMPGLTVCFSSEPLHCYPHQVHPQLLLLHGKTTVGCHLCCSEYLLRNQMRQLTTNLILGVTGLKTTLCQLAVTATSPVSRLMVVPWGMYILNVYDTS